MIEANENMSVLNLVSIENVGKPPIQMIFILGFHLWLQLLKMKVIVFLMIMQQKYVMKYSNDWSKLKYFISGRTFSYKVENGLSKKKKKSGREATPLDIFKI